MRTNITALLSGLVLGLSSAQVSAENLDVLMSQVFQANEAPT